MPNFTEFNLNPNPAGNDFIVGYKSDGSAEYRATAQSLATALSSATVVSLSTTAPNNNIAARSGTIGIDPNNNVWIKETGTGTSGWESIFTSTSGAYYANIILQDASGVVLNLGELGRVGSTVVVGDGSTVGGIVASTFTLINATSSIQPIIGNNSASKLFANVGGGQCNIAGGPYSNVAGGQCNIACAGFMELGDSTSTIGGGILNRANGPNTVIAGGGMNTANGFGSFIGGGICNTACGVGFAIGGSIAGGSCNTASGSYSFIGGGQNNNTRGFANTFILGSSLSATVANFTYVNNLSSQGVVVANPLRVGNSVSATGPVGTVTGKVEVFNAAGSSLGFIPIYNTIT